jgi:ribose transport system ATP-binding protein
MVGTERSLDYYQLEQQHGAISEEPLLELRGATVAGEFEDVDLVIRPGEIVGVAGVVGSGKSTLAAAVAGAVALSAGTLSVGGRARRSWSVVAAVRHGVLYVPPERALDSLLPTATVRSNISIGFLDTMRSPITRLLKLRALRAKSEALAARLRVKATSLSVPIGELSGGNQQKTVFARWQGRECRLSVLNDPTRGIDVGTREEIYGLIRGMAAQGIGVLMAAESLEEVIGLSDRIIVMKDGRISAELDSPPAAKPAEVDVIRHMM